MAETTTNYGLVQPSYDDKADIAVLNANAGIIDAKMKEIADAGGGAGASGGILENYREKLVTLASGAINLNNGNVFSHAPSASTTYSITNAGAGAHSFTLIITQPTTAVVLTFPASVKWQGGTIPDMTTGGKTYVLTFLSINSGTTWLGMFGGEF